MIWSLESVLVVVWTSGIGELLLLLLMMTLLKVLWLLRLLLVLVGATIRTIVVRIRMVGMVSVGVVVKVIPRTLLVMVLLSSTTAVGLFTTIRSLILGA